MLHRAIQSFNQLIAMNLSSELTIWILSNRNIALPEEWQIEGPVYRFYDYLVIVSGTTSPRKLEAGTVTTPGINLF